MVSFRNTGAAVLLLCLLPTCAMSQEDGCSTLDDDLECSACSLFINEFFNAVVRAPSALFKEGTSTKNLWYENSGQITPAKVYEQRIRAIYKENAPKKTRRVYNLMKKYAGKEYDLYLRICDKYQVTPEPEYESPDDEDDDEERNAWKNRASEEALETVKSLPTKEGMQWALSGATGKRKFVDFNKLMSSGGAMENLSMGGHVSEQLGTCLDHLAVVHSEELGTVIAKSDKPFSSGLHKVFCKKQGHCGRKKKKNDDL